MFGKKEAARQRELAASQQQAANRYLEQATTKSPLELAREKEATDWISDTNSSTFDVTKTRGMSPYMDLYNQAVAARGEERQGGTGLVGMGQSGSNPQLATLLDKYNAERRRERAGGALENAFRMKDATMRGDVMPLLAHQQNRGMGLAALTSGNANAGWQRYLAQLQSSGFTNSTLFNTLYGGAQKAAQAMGG